MRTGITLIFGAAIACGAGWPANHAVAGLITLVSFSGSNGASPSDGTLGIDSAGNLYGTTFSGGSSFGGVEYELPAGSSAVTVLYSFNPSTLGFADQGTAFDGQGTLYGVAAPGGPIHTIFSLSTSGGPATVLAQYGVFAVGAQAEGGNPILDANHNLYNTTYTSGPGGTGSVYRLDAGSNTPVVLKAFGNDTANPSGRLLLDSQGNIYGTTQAGDHGYGSIYKIAAGSNAFTIMHSFQNIDGGNPSAGLIADNHGNLYGTTFNGGSGGVGTIFKISIVDNSFTTLAAFQGVDGANPAGEMVRDASGNLYGTTSRGGSSGLGTLFELKAGSNTITTLASFDGTNGDGPEAGLVFDNQGNIYGTTFRGGASNLGTIFEYSSVPEPTSLILAVIACVCGVGRCAAIKLKANSPTARSQPELPSVHSRPN